jgi:mRNA deadenylase 3'-5' endonuclease subunit Ccr4
LNLYHLLCDVVRGVVDQNHSSWDSVNVFTWSNGLSTNSSKEDLSHSINADSNSLPRLVHPFKWLSAAGYPQFSNYTKTFKELLDYIYVERHKFKVLKVAPIPTEDVLSENCAIPSEVFPSDHLALVVDVHLSQGNV